MLEAQYPNGGWPQFYPLRKGYYTHITYNDGAMIGVMNFLDGKFNFVDNKTRRRCIEAVAKGIDITLQCQVEVNNTLTVWCAQHDEVTLKPAKARAYELKTLSGSESVGITKFLMSIDNPSPEIIKSVKAAINWFELVQLKGIRLVKIENPQGKYGYDYVIGFDPASQQSMWARFYEIETNYPIFVGRDGVVHYSIGEIEIERRTGYGWLGTWAEDLVEKDYPKWCEKWNIED